MRRIGDAFLVAATAVGVVVAITHSSPSLVDRAQARFEVSKEGRGYNWPVFKQPNSIAKLNCRDISRRLRVCDVVIPAVNPMTGEKDGWIHKPFACDMSMCGWLQE